MVTTIKNDNEYMNTWFVVVSLVLLLHLEEAWAVGNNASVKCIEKERLSLLSLKRGFVDEYDSLSSWGSGESQKECCNWKCVYCDSLTGHVVGLSLFNYQLEGTLSPSLAELHQLRTLNLSFNHFNLTPFPSFITSLNELQVLDLSFNNLEGEIPQELGHLSSLRTLKLSTNQLEGGIPKSLVLLCNIRELDLGENSLNGQIDDFVASFSRNCGDNNTLQFLDLSRNQFSGPLPSFSQLSSLEQLYLGHNHLNGTLNDSIGLLSNLQVLDLSFNNLEGEILQELGDLSSLQTLDLRANQLEGSIPKSLALLCNICYLDLAKNSLSGQIDDFTASFSRNCGDNNTLQELKLSSNQFSGPLPTFSELSSLTSLYLDHNHLNGTLNDSFGLLSNLQVLRIGYNSSEGVISESHFLKLFQVDVLDFSFNHFVFQVSPDWVPPFRSSRILLASCKLGPSFPMWLQTQTSCTYLDISSAGISGTIPSWFWNFPFNMLNVSHNQFTGEISKLPLFSYDLDLDFDFSSNLFEGSISSNLSYGTITLYLSHNMFTDATSLLCPNMSTSLIVLDLSNNQLSGTLPDCWKLFESLVVLKVANN